MSWNEYLHAFAIGFTGVVGGRFGWSFVDILSARLSHYFGRGL